MNVRGAVLDYLYGSSTVRAWKDAIGRPVKRALVGRHGIHLIVAELKRARTNVPVRCVYDIGAAVGDTARLFLTEFPVAEVTCFEPHLASYLTLMRRTGKDKDRIRWCRMALTDAAAAVDLHVCSYPDASSTLPLSAMILGEGKREVAIETVPGMPLDTVRATLPAGPIDLVKIDVEGGETGVLRGGDRTFQSDVLNVVVEIQPLFWGRRAVQHIGIFQAFHDWGFEFLGNYGDYWFSKDEPVLATKYGLRE